MSRTSSPTSTRRSRRHSPVALAIWLAISASLIAAAFWAQGQDGTTEDALYDADLAVSGLFFYAIMIGASLLLARAYRRPLRALGFRRFRLRWLWISFGVVHGILGALPPLALFGVGLAWVRLRSASVWPSFVAHAVYNGLGILLLVLAWATDTQVS